MSNSFYPLLAELEEEVEEEAEEIEEYEDYTEELEEAGKYFCSERLFFLSAYHFLMVLLTDLSAYICTINHGTLFPHQNQSLRRQNIPITTMMI